jgi:catechol 2,3-dioxygenase-like lactoylglutathione lyase family enzyme
LLTSMRLIVIAFVLAFQVSAANPAGVAMGHLHYHVQDVVAHLRFWATLGGVPMKLGALDVVKFPEVLVVLTEGASSGGTEGSVVNHVAFRVQSLAEIERAGLKVERLEQFTGIGSVRTPEGERIELFDNTATNLTFTSDSGQADDGAARHNRPLQAPIAFHHIHLYLPEGAETAAKAWYADTFGGIPGKRWNYHAVDLPGVNLNFSGNRSVQAPTKGRMLDHIGFAIRNLEAFCRRLEARGLKFDVPFSKGPDGMATAWLTDPWGTSIELTEGLTR